MRTLCNTTYSRTRWPHECALTERVRRDDKKETPTETSSFRCLGRWCSLTHNRLLVYSNFPLEHVLGSRLAVELSVENSETSLLGFSTDLRTTCLWHSIIIHPTRFGDSHSIKQDITIFGCYYLLIMTPGKTKDETRDPVLTKIEEGNSSTREVISCDLDKCNCTWTGWCQVQRWEGCLRGHVVPRKCRRRGTFCQLPREGR